MATLDEVLAYMKHLIHEKKVSLDRAARHKKALMEHLGAGCPDLNGWENHLLRTFSVSTTRASIGSIRSFEKWKAEREQIQHAD